LAISLQTRGQQPVLLHSVLQRHYESLPTKTYTVRTFIGQSKYTGEFAAFISMYLLMYDVHRSRRTPALSLCPTKLQAIIRRDVDISSSRCSTDNLHRTSDHMFLALHTRFLFGLAWPFAGGDCWLPHTSTPNK
jgi:hypothetical protein